MAVARPRIVKSGCWLIERGRTVQLLHQHVQHPLTLLGCRVLIERRARG